MLQTVGDNYHRWLVTQTGGDRMPPSTPSLFDLLYPRTFSPQPPPARLLFLTLSHSLHHRRQPPLHSSPMTAFPLFVADGCLPRSLLPHPPITSPFARTSPRGEGAAAGRATAAAFEAWCGGSAKIDQHGRAASVGSIENGDEIQAVSSNSEGLAASSE
jgi:hypothetical protein